MAGLLDMAFGLLGQAISVGVASAKLAADRRREDEAAVPGPAARALPAIPELSRSVMPPLAPPPIPAPPSLPAMPFSAPPAPPGLLSGAAVIAGRAVAVEAPDGATAAVAESYAAEWGEESLSVACLPCTIRHIGTMTAAAEAAAQTDDPAVRRENMAIVLGEALVWQRYDTTPGKLARAKPEARSAIQELVPQVQAATAGIPRDSADLVLAWAAVGEALRFAKSANPTESDRREILVRMADVNGWVGYAENARASDLAVARLLDDVRTARHTWTRDGFTSEALAFAEPRLRAAAVALLPDVDRATAGNIHRQLRVARDRFYARALSGAAG